MKDPSELVDTAHPSTSSAGVAYPEKIVKRLQSEAKRIASGLGPGYEEIISLAPDKARNASVDKQACAFWKGTIAGPKGTVYEMATVDLEIFIGPDYPFKGPTITYETEEDHVVEFVVGKNQTDPRERNILWGWTPAMGLADAVVEISRIIQGQHITLVREQLELERKRREKVAKLQQQALADSAEQGGQTLCLDVGTPMYQSGSNRNFNLGAPSSTTGKTIASSVVNTATAETALDPPPVVLPPISGNSPMKVDMSMPSQQPARQAGLDERLSATATNDGGLLVVKLQPAKALPRRGSFRASFGQKEMIEEIARAAALAGGEGGDGGRAAAGTGLGLDLDGLLANR